MSTRRQFLAGCSAAAAAGWMGIPAWSAGAAAAAARRFHLSVSIDALNADPELLDIVAAAGIQDLWLACFFQGQWHNSSEEYIGWRDRIRAKGLGCHQITIPFGHPSFDAKPPDYMPGVDASHWKPGIRPDGRQYWGVSLHPPITDENVAALSEIAKADPGIVFVDDDFRLAPSPNDIGGCFCEEHKKAFLEKHGYTDAQWTELLDHVAVRRLTPLTRAWVDDTCDGLTASFRAQQQALAPAAELGIMVMYLGAEKAGIRLSDYTGVPFRVGELMFNDQEFDPLKGKTNELFSALFHRRFTPPERAYSETTAWPPDQLSAPNMAAKLIITTIADIRNTMFMSGNTPFPRTHWETLAPAMREQAAMHEKLAGHTPRGPFKHFWGEHSRYVGDANPYSLFLACGVPFEVTDTPAADGWTFLSRSDVDGVLDGAIKLAGTTFVHAPGQAKTLPGARQVTENLEELFKLKHELLPQLKDVPCVEEDLPVVCAWYPTAGAVLLWNLGAEQVTVHLQNKGARTEHTLPPLKAQIVSA